MGGRVYQESALENILEAGYHGIKENGIFQPDKGEERHSRQRK